MKPKKQKPYLTPNEVAEMLMVSPTTVRQWAGEGKLRSSATPGGHRRFMRSDVEQFSRDRGLTLQLPDNESTRVLIVDDDPDIVSYLSRMLDLAGARVETQAATNGFDAGQMVQHFQPHIMLLDIMMPGMDGIAVCHSLKQDPSTKAIRVIAMTGLDDAHTIEQILNAGAETCLRKPFDAASLFAAVGVSMDAA